MNPKVSYYYVFLCLIVIAFGFVIGDQRSEIQTLKKERDEFFSRDPTINKLYCQPFRTETERATNEWYLRKERYQVIHATEVEHAFTARSSGDLEIIDQTNHECFYDKWMTQKFPAQTYYARKIQKPRWVK